MNTAFVHRKHSQRSTHNWETQENVVTHDDVIIAYLKGKAAGRSEQQKINLGLFKQNLEKAKKVSEDLYNQIEEIGFKIIDLHLKADSITSFNTLLIVDKHDFISEKFLRSFSIARILKNQADDETFDISFTFTPASSYLDENCFKHDGFFAKYAKA